MAEFYNKDQFAKTNAKDYQAFAIKDAEIYNNQNSTYNEILKIVRKAFSVIKFNDLIK